MGGAGALLEGAGALPEGTGAPLEGTGAVLLPAGGTLRGVVGEACGLGYLMDREPRHTDFPVEALNR